MYINRDGTSGMKVIGLFRSCRTIRIKACVTAGEWVEMALVNRKALFSGLFRACISRVLPRRKGYSTVTDFARFLGLSMSVPLIRAT